MIEIDLVLKIHSILVERHGGTQGVRDISSLESALSRPFMTFDEKDLYPSPILKSAALVESLIDNHPFLDGNKRVGYVLMRLFLLENNIDIQASQEEKYEFVMNIANGKFKFQEISEWIEKNALPING
jgi:death on curing protein